MKRTTSPTPAPRSRIPFPLLALYAIGLTLIALNLKNYLLN